MAAIFQLRRLLIWLPPTEITKAFFHKIAFSRVTSTDTDDDSNSDDNM